MKSLRFILPALLALATTSIYAQEKAGKKDTAAHVKLFSYACPMHANFISDKPAKCPKCGKDMAQLSAKERLKRDVTKAYNCPVHLDVISVQPDKCPKCGKNLTLSKKEQMKAEVVKLYTCPMHPNVESNKPGKCPKCGMELIEKEKQ